MTIDKVALGLVLALSVAVLSACKSDEEQARDHYESGMELLAAGDTDRALVEFRNVFKLDGTHREARVAYAEAVRARGELSEAYSQYLRLVEQYPEDAEGNRALAEMSLAMNDWEAVERYAPTALRLLPDDPEVKALGVTVAYRKALQSRDEAARRAALADADALLAADPALVVARRVVLDGALRDSAYEDALAILDAGIAATPEEDEFYRARASVLYQLGDNDALEQQLLAMVARDPADVAVQNSLVSWYLGQRRPEDAEAFLRAQAETTADPADAQTRLVAFLVQTRGAEAARAELDAIVAADGADAARFRVMRAGIDFEAGRRDAAIAEMRDVLDTAPDAPDAERTRVTLARMLSATGNEVGARALVEEVLGREPAQPDALKLRAAWLIDDDRTGDALITLREALDRNPRDPAIMTLMAQAHERDGSRDLMGEMLSLAVGASGSAPAESLRYAALLEQDGKMLPAESVLIDALRLQPQNPDLLIALGRVYVGMRDWGRTEQVVDTLRDIDTPATRAAANDLTARRLAAQDQDQELVGFLQDMVASGEGGRDARVALIRASVLRGDVGGALEQSAAMLAEAPDDPAVRFLHASVLISAGRVPQGEQELRGLTETLPRFEAGWLGLYGLMTQQGRPDEARAALDGGLEALPESTMLQWTRAGVLERAGDIDGAIAIYQAMYDRDSNAPIIANNLASLLSARKDDPESLDRAWTVARRLRGTDVAAFQDTYGWIAYRRGSYDEALSHLEPAARGLPGDPAVRYHLAMTYGALARYEQALALLQPLEAEGARAEVPPYWLQPVRDEITRLTDPSGAGN